MAGHCPSCAHENREAARFCEECGAALTAASSGDLGSRPLPTTVGDGRYRVRQLLGEGSRKVVYAASDTRLGRDVAVAIIKTDGLDAAGRRRIDREARAMARLGDHPNIVTVFDVGDENDQPFIVSELMPGGSVADAIQQADDHRLPVPDALRIGEQVALALAHAHERGVVHRDLKPANVWLAADGTARLGDFGLAVEADRSRITSEGMVVGTVAYLAPEQAVGRAPDRRSDLYALGTSLYEMLTGRPPFLGDDAVTVISQHLNTAPVSPTWHNAAVTPPIEALVLSLLEKDPSARPADADAVVSEFRRLRAEQAPIAADVPAAASPATQAASFGRFVGRVHELDALKALFDDVLSGRSKLVMVVGEPGIGKTRLVEELGVHAAVRGAQVCWGHCYEGELGLPYLPFVEALRTYVRDRSDIELRAELSTGAPEVATLVSDLRTRFPDLPVSPPLEGDAERMRLFEGVSAFLANAARARPLVLMLDDLHWSDKPTLLLLQYLARNLRRDRIMIACTYRDVELDRTHPLSDMIAALRREHLYERVLLRGFDRDEVKSFIEAVGEQEAPAILAETVHRETEGNPFFVAEILRNLGESGALARVDGHWVEGADGVAAQLPEGVREVIGRRLSRLGEDCNRMLTVGAAMPGGFQLDVVIGVLDTDEDQALDLLEEALDRQVLRERRDQPGTYEFNHALIRQTLYAELSTPRRIRLHRQILAALEDLYASNIDAHLTDLAYHAFQAAPGGAIDKAVDYATRAGRRAAASAAHEEAARSYDLALQALELDEAADEHRCAELLLDMGDAYHHAGDAEGARTALVRAAEIGRRLDDAGLIARAAIVLSGLRWTTSGSDPLMMELLEEAAARRTEVPDALRARLLARLGNQIAFVDATRHADLAREAVEAGRRSGDPGALASALATAGFTTQDWAAGERRAHYIEVERLAAEAGDFDLEVASANTLVIAALFEGDREEFDVRMATHLRLAEQSRSPFIKYTDTLFRGCAAVFEGRYDDGERLAFEALEIARRIQDRSSVEAVGALLFALLREQGRSSDLEAPTRRTVEAYPRLAVWRAGLAQVLADEERLDEAAEHVELLARDNFSAVGDDVLRMYTLAALSEVVSLLRDAELAEELYGLLAPNAGSGVMIGATAYHGATDRYLGLLATALGRYDTAVGHHEAALGVHERMHAAPWVARSQFDLACALIARGADLDRERALGLLNDALDAATAIGMNRLVEEVLKTKLELQGVQTSGSIMASIDVVAAGVSIERPDLRGHAASDGTVAVLFSDIEGYTMLNERLGDTRTQALLRSHDALVRDAVAAHGGTVVKSAGDGYMIVFSDARAAVACAVALQRLHDEHDFGIDAGAIRVRMGTHVGHVIQEGDDFFGRTVILAARVAAQATGGEILVSEELVRAAGDVSDLGTKVGAPREVELKGLRGTQTVHPLEW
jgi:class 3 adenylate cyclase